MQPDLERSQRADEEPVIDGTALDRYRIARAVKAEIDNEILLGKIVYRADIREGMARMVAILRQAGDTIEANYGPAAGDVLREAFDEIEQEAIRMGKEKVA